MEKSLNQRKGLETPDGRDSVTVSFDEIGAVIMRISNVNNFDTSGEFSFKVTESQKIILGDHTVDIATGSSLPGCEINNSCYIPSSLNIQPSQVVLWDNKDSEAHTVSSGTPDTGVSAIFDSTVNCSRGKIFLQI